jgi:hypothetical protein
LSRVAFFEFLFSILYVLRSGHLPRLQALQQLPLPAPNCRGPVCPSELLRQGCADARRILVRQAPSAVPKKMYPWPRVGFFQLWGLSESRPGCPTFDALFLRG